MDAKGAKETKAVLTADDRLNGAAFSRLLGFWFGQLLIANC
jgi:hypothetical protein